MTTFYNDCRHIALVRHGTLLSGSTPHHLYPAVHETEWMAVTQFELMDSIRADAPEGRLGNLDAARKDTLWFITLAARGSDQAFASMVAQDRLGLASYMQILRDSWEKARKAPPTRARLGESREHVLARLNRATSVMQAYENGRGALYSGAFCDNATQHFLLPYSVARRDALIADVPCRWRAARPVVALIAPEQQAMTRMYEALRVGDDVIDLMVEVCGAPPNVNVLAERLKQFQIAAADLALAEDVTADLPSGAPGPVIDLDQNPFDAALCLYDSALLFESR